MSGCSAAALIVVWLAGSLGWSTGLHAADIAVHGFGTIGGAYIDQPEGWSYSRSLNQRTSGADVRAELDSVLGLQVNIGVTQQLEFVGQASVAALNGDARASDYLGLALLAWRPGPDWTVRLGRVNLDAFLISDHRDVGFAHPFIRPPVEFYARMPTWLDGGDVSRSWLNGGVQWQAGLFAGSTSAGTGDGRLTLRPLVGVMLSREAHGLLLRASAVHARTRDAIGALQPLLDGLRQMQALPVAQVAGEAAQLQAAMMTRGKRTRFLSAAGSYDRHGWLVTAEISRAAVEDSDSISFTSGYLSVGRRLGPVTVFAMHSATVRDAGPYPAPDWVTPLQGLDPLLAQQAQAIADGATVAINKIAGHQSTTSAGLRWDVAPRVALKVQWDRIHTRRAGDGLWRRADGQSRRAHVVAVAADFVF